MLGVALLVESIVVGGGTLGYFKAACSSRSASCAVRAGRGNLEPSGTQDPVLGRFLGAPALYAMAYGEIGSSLYYALGITAVYALSLTPAVFLAAGVIFALTAAAYAEGAATIPEPGGASTFAGARSTTWWGSSPAGRRCSTT